MKRAGGLDLDVAASATSRREERAATVQVGPATSTATAAEEFRRDCNAPRARRRAPAVTTDSDAAGAAAAAVPAAIRSRRCVAARAAAARATRVNEAEVVDGPR